MKKTTIVISVILIVFGIVLACFQQWVLSILTSHLAILLCIFSLIQSIYEDIQRIKTVQMIQSLATIVELGKSHIKGGEVSSHINDTAKKVRDIFEQMKAEQEKKEAE